MGKTEKPPVDVRHICRYNAEIIAKLKDSDWNERLPRGCLTDHENNVAYITDFKSFEDVLDYSFDDYSEFFQIKKADYKEWKEVEFIPYNTKYGINPDKIIEVLRILHGGYKAKIMGEVVLGFTPVTWWSAKPIVVFMPYKDDYAVFIVAPLMGSDGADLELEDVAIDETISFVAPVRVSFYYDLKTQTIGYSYNDKIVSVDEFKDEWGRKHEEYEKQLGKAPELTRYFFGGFGAKIVTIEGFLTFIRDSKGTEGDRDGIRKSFAWVKKKYEQIPFSGLSESPYYNDYKPLFAINEILPELAKNIALALSEGGEYCDTAIGQLNKIHELGREYTKTTEKYYKELTGQNLREADVETRALMEYRSKEQIQDQVSWLKEQGIEPNSFEKAAMEYYGVEITEEKEARIDINTIVSTIKREQEGIISVAEEGESTVTEYGSLICLIDNKVILEGWHKGEAWGTVVKVKKGCKAGRRVGTIHTHPSVWLSELSGGDFLNILLNEDSIAFLAYKNPGIGGYYQCDAYIFDKMSPIYTKLTKKAWDYRDGKISEAEFLDIVSRQIRMVYDKEILFYKKLEEREEEPPWRRLMDVLKELEKEHGFEVPEDIAIAAGAEVGIEKPEDLIGDLKRDGILYSPAKGLIARVEKEEKPEEKPRADEDREQVRSKIEPPKIPEKVKIEEKVKIRVLEDIPTFMGTDGEIYKLKKDDIVELPKTNADVLCERGVMELFVEKPPEKPVPDKVTIHGILKTRYRCPICYRAAPDNFCMVHSDVESIDLLAADESVKDAVIDLTFLDLFKAKHPEKKRWTVEELHETMGIDVDYAPGFLAKPRIPETYAQYYARELGVEIEEITPPEVVEEEEEELKRISEALALAKQKPFGAIPVEDVLFFPSVIIIAGKRRSGKTAIGFYILEIAPVANKFVLGMPEHVWGYLPEEIKPLPLTADVLEELPVDAIFLIDEASLSFYAKKHRSNLSAIIDAITLKSAQRGQTFIFISHNLRKLQPNIILESDILLFKEPSLMQVEMERREIISRMKKVKAGFDAIPAPERVRFCFMFSDDFTGLTINPLPSFWRIELSEVWRLYTAQAEMEELADGYEETIERRIVEEVRPPLLLEKEFVPTPPRKYTPPITQISAAREVPVSVVWDQGGNLQRAAWLVHAGVEDALVVQENYRSNWNYLSEELQHKLVGEI